MNVFEDLIVELKEENLLENTVIDDVSPENADSEENETVEVLNNDEAPEFAAPGDPEEESEEADIVSELTEQMDSSVEVEVVDTDPGDVAASVAPATKPKKAKAGKEFFKKRAVDEVSSHQMVEHVLTGVEREYMKVVPKTFDDFDAKKALHIFLNVAENSNSEEHKVAEFALMQETESWSMALLERDRNISVANIRRYCENSKPALSSQAMLALARFYRNAPYSESIRSKFDFVITRLFSRPAKNDKRTCLFTRDEMLGHINTLYSEWSSIPLYTAEEDDSNVLLTGLSFDDLAAEAEKASHFDQLIESDFFGRLRLFKESISELFYAPIVTAAAIDSNIRIGNAYVNLIVREREKLDSASIQSKYGGFNEQSVSDAAGRTLDLVELLNGLTEQEDFEYESPENETEYRNEDEPANVTAQQKKAVKESLPFVERMIGDLLNMNRWLIGVCLAMLIAVIGLYVWSTYIVDEKVSTVGVINVDLENNELGEYIKSGRISGDTFYGLLLPSWDALPKEKRQEFLQKALHAGPEKGYTQVNLTAKDGKQAGFASDTRLEVIMP